MAAPKVSDDIGGDVFIVTHVWVEGVLKLLLRKLQCPVCNAELPKVGLGLDVLARSPRYELGSYSALNSTPRAASLARIAST